jgi:hypothetical protein
MHHGLQPLLPVMLAVPQPMLAEQRLRLRLRLRLRPQPKPMLML